MLEFIAELKVPFFLKRDVEVVNITVKQLGKSTVTVREMLFCAIHPDGNVPKNVGYVSIIFAQINLRRFIGRDITSIHLTVSVVDINGASRFPKSFGVSVVGISKEERSSEELQKKLSSVLPIRLERFVRRGVLLDSREELLPEDTLTLRYEIVLHYDSLALKNEEFQYLKRQEERLLAIAKEESWFKHVLETDGARFLFDFRNANSPLCTRLRQKSEFFEYLFQMPCRVEEDGWMTIHLSEFTTFHNMLFYVRFNRVKCKLSNSEYCDLYEMANKYEILELQEICSSYLKQKLTSTDAFKVLRVADLCNDYELRTMSFKLVLESNWKDWPKPEIYLKLKKQPPSLVRELVCAAKLLKNDDSDTLYDLAARQILLNRKKLEHSPTWAVFSMEMPDLAKLISSWDPVEKYKDHAVSYDFYR